MPREIRETEMLGTLGGGVGIRRGDVSTHRVADASSKEHSPLCQNDPGVTEILVGEMLWLTNSTMRPRRATSFIFPRHLAWKAGSPTARTSSTTRISGFRYAATAKAREIHAARIVLVSMNLSTSANDTISSNLRM